MTAGAEVCVGIGSVAGGVTGESEVVAVESGGVAGVGSSSDGASVVSGPFSEAVALRIFLIFFY